MTGGGGSELGTGGTNVSTAGQWTHVVAKREANLLKIYINGSVFSSATVASPFNYALSDAEIQQIYQSN